MDDFWQSLVDNRSVNIDGAIYEWLGYDNEKIYDRKATFIKLLLSHNITFREVTIRDNDFEQFPEFVEEAKNMTKQALVSQKWSTLGSLDFRKVIMCIRTNKGDQNA